MAGRTPSTLRSSYSAFPDLVHLLDQIPQPTCRGACSGCDRCSKASNQLEDLKKDALYIQRSLEKLAKFEQDLGVCYGGVVEIDERQKIHQLARAVQHLKNQLPSASYYPFPTRTYNNNDDLPPPADDSNPIGRGYSHLDLKQKKCLWCFLVFPENEEIKKRVLINWWIGEGYVTGVPLERAGEKLLDLLQEKQLIKQVKKKKRGTDCWQMDLAVRSFLLGKGKEDMFFDLGRQILDGKVMVLKSDLQVGSMDGVVDPVLTAFNVSKTTITEKEARTLASMESLMVLHLGRSLLSQEVKIQENNLKLITKSVFKMRRLRLLSFQGISSLIELHVPIFFQTSLMVLDVRACRSLVSLNWRVGSLKNLRHLDMTGCHLLLRMPIEMDRLSNLEVLKGFVIRYMPRSCTLGHLRKLKKLHKLSLYVVRKDFPRRQDMLHLANIKGLVKLKIVWNPTATKEGEAVHPVSAAQQDQQLHLKKLHKLDLWCTPVYATHHLLAPTRFPILRQLNVRGAEYINHLNSNSTEDAEVKTWNVEMLRLQFLPNLEMAWEEVKSLFPKLSYLELQDCPKLQCPPDCDEEGVWNNP